MHDPENPNDRLVGNRLSRAQFLRMAATATAGGSLFLAACGGSDDDAGSADSKKKTLADEPGRLALLEWAGYDAKQLWSPYRERFPGKPPRFAFLTSDDQALAKVRSGFSPDVVHPSTGYVRDWVDADLVQPWDMSLIKNAGNLRPNQLEAGKIDGKQYFIPASWGFTSPLYRADKVSPEDESWKILLDDRYAGKIAWWDGVETLAAIGYAMGIRDPWNMSDDELDSVRETAIAKKKNVRTFWTTETDLTNDFISGTIWIAYAFQGTYTAAKAKGRDVVYMFPKEKPMQWIDGFVLLKGSERFNHAHAYVDSWVSKSSGEWLEDNYGYGSSNMTTKPKNKDLVETLRLEDEAVASGDSVNVQQHIPERRKYQRAWSLVKAA